MAEGDDVGATRERIVYEPAVMPHPLQVVISGAIIKAKAKRRGDAFALAAGVRAVLEVQPELGIAGAYELVSRLWIR